MVCKNCGNNVNDTDSICMMCGTPIDRSGGNVANQPVETVQPVQPASNGNTPNGDNKNKLFIIIAGILLVIIIALVVVLLNNKSGNDGDKPTTTNNNTTTSSTTTESTTTSGTTSSSTTSAPTTSSTTTSSAENQPADKCASPLECFSKIELTYSLEQVEMIMGSFGENTYDSETYKTYEWEFPDKESVKVAFSNGNVSEVSLDLNNEKHLMTGVSFSRYNEIKEKIDNKETVTYDLIKSYVGDVDGIQIKKSNYSVEYTWIIGKYEYLNAYFDTKGNCTMIAGMISKN